MASFDWKKYVEDSIKDGLIITATTTGIFYVLKAANVKPPKASLYATDIMKLVCGVLVKDYTVYKKCIKGGYNKHFMALVRAIRLHNAKCRSILRSVPPRRVLLTHAYAGLLFNR